MSVGLPDGQMGNSEVGHTNIGGRIIYQELTRITKTIKTENSSKTRLLLMQWTRLLKNGTHFTLWDFFQTAVFTATLNISTVFLNLLRKKVLQRYTFIAFLDGRDVPPSSAAEYADEAC